MTTTSVAQIKVPCELGAIRRVAEWFGQECGSSDPASVFELELALVEAMTNLVKHSGLADSGENVEIELKVSPDQIEIVLKDTGDPVASEALQISESALEFNPDDIANVPASGLGLAIIREATDEFDYCSADGHNIMRLMKRLA